MISIVTTEAGFAVFDDCYWMPLWMTIDCV